MPSSLKLMLRVFRALRGAGIFRLSLAQSLGILKVWWHCGNSYAALASFAALRSPSAWALHDDDGPLTFAELALAVDQFALALLA